MSGATDSGMVKTMGAVMGAVTLIAIFCVIAARSLSGVNGDAMDPMMRNALIQRIEPVAAVRTSMDDLPAADPQAVMAVAGGTKSGAELVNGACAACHLAGVAGAPALDADAEWASRREAGLDALVASVINGKGAMPARGGSAYSDDEIRLAVEHMAGFEVSEADTPADTAVAAVESAVEKVETAAADVAQSTETAVTAAVEKVETAVADAGATAAAAVAAVVGQAPDGLTDSVKSTVDGLCTGCHLAGVANAPKIGDKEAWQARADKGMDTLTSSVINGMGAMPPRGGSALTDDEIPMAIQYLMSK